MNITVNTLGAKLQEEEIRTRELDKFNGTISREREAEHQRNRSRVMEITQLLERIQKEMMDLVTENPNDEDYGADDS